MNNFIWVILESIRNVLVFIVVFYTIPYMIRRGWGDAENSTKKVCDTCFRDIKKWNEVVENLTKKGKNEE